MWILYVALLIAVIAAMSGFIIARSRKRIRKRYSSKSRAEITEARVFAKKHFILFLCFAFVVPIPLSFFSALFTEGSLRIVFIAVIVCLILSSLIQAFYWWNVEGVTHSLLDDLSDTSLDGPNNA